MPTFKLDDRDIPFEPGDTVIRAAHRAGIDVPHYCWHPGLSVAANCRMCLVELLPPPGRPALMLDVLNWDSEKQDYVVTKKPKLVPACQQQLSDGMQVKSQSSPHVAQARAAVQEMLLLNHPVDCPICDQAGECRLQDYWLEHQGTEKRMRDEPIHKPKAVVFGPTIVYDAERCILCTRCIRVCDELAKDSVLSIRERSNLGEIVVSPGRQLDHPYTLMTEYVCPVGALTAIDFRFKARVWFLRSARTVCVGCATGCNSFTDYDPRYQKVYRYRPRENLEVNRYWMCDEGMLDYRRIHENRVLQARVDGEVTTRKAALEKAASLLKGAEPERLAVVLSAQHSNEDNFALVALGRELKVNQFFLSARPNGAGDQILRHVDKNPNIAGVSAILSRAPGRFADLVKALTERKFTHVLALGSAVGEAEQASVLRSTKNLVVFATHLGPLVEHAAVVLPASSWAEGDGTFVNAKGKAQLSAKAISPQGDSRPAWELIAVLGRALGRATPWTKLGELRAAIPPKANPLSVRAGASA
ncbi:MAG TPA: 2Fe-2S iron-sulfur cluster-binding protein [Polyangiaceae bacterium]|jgi:NADH-quinone oxidoreductase subunit G